MHRNFKLGIGPGAYRYISHFYFRVGHEFFSVVDPKLFSSDPDPSFQEISDPDSDPT